MSVISKRDTRQRCIDIFNSSGVSPTVFAEQYFISEHRLVGYLNDQLPASTTLLACIADYGNTTVEFLLTGKPPRVIKPLICRIPAEY